MDLTWPGLLALLALAPLLSLLYWWSLRRRRRYAVRFSSLSLVREALPKRSRWRRHVPFALFLLALTSLVIALTRPVAITLVPAGQVTVILAIDVSRSMLQADIPPNRLIAAENAALSFVRRQHPSTRIGVVAFAGFAQLVVPPTNDKAVLESVIKSLYAGRGTNIGDGILEALDAIAEVNGNVAPTTGDASQGAVPVTGHVPDIIVLLTDGVPTTGPEPLYAAQQAADRGVRVFTIGFGTEMGASDFGGPWGGSDQFGGFRFRRGIDEQTLKDMAAITGAEYYQATSAGELQKVFDELPTYLITREEREEISVFFAAAGALLALLAISLSMRWNPLP